MRVAVVHNRDASGVINVFGPQNRERYNPRTVERVARALEAGGHTVRVIDGNMHVIERLQDFMPRVISGERPGMVFNMAYGIQGVSRYTHLPAMLEMLGVPYVGSGPQAHGMALDKVIAKIMFEAAGLPTAKFWNFASPDDQFEDLVCTPEHPLIVKPKMEAVSYGIRIVENEGDLRDAVATIVNEFGQHVLVEQFIAGRELAIGLLGNGDPEVLPIVEIDLEGDPNAIQTDSDKLRSPRGKLCPAPLTDEQTADLQELAKRAFRSLELYDFDEALEAGACGWSAQWAGNDSGQRDYDGTSMLSDLMSVEQAHGFSEVLARRRTGLTQINGHGPNRPFTETWARHEKLAEISGRPVLHNVVEFFTDQQGNAVGNYRETIEWLNAANARGNRVLGQALSVPVASDFTFEHFNGFDTSLVWREATLGTVEERREKLADPGRRRALKEEFDRGEGPGSVVTGSASSLMNDLVVAEVLEPSLKPYEGLSVREIVERDNKHTIDAMLDIAVADNLRTLFQTPVPEMNVEAAEEVLTSPFTVPGVSDGGAHTKFLTLGAYPTYLLARLVRDHEVMDLEQAHWRLSTLPANLVGFKDRGWLREGAAADIVIYDLEELKILPKERLDDQPAGAWRRVQRAEGYRWIMVNGGVTFADGVCTGATPGQLLRSGRGTPT